MHAVPFDARGLQHTNLALSHVSWLLHPFLARCAYVTVLCFVLDKSFMASPTPLKGIFPGGF